MRVVITVVFVLSISFNILAQTDPAAKNNKDSVSKLLVTGSLTLANIGFAPIPAFSFNHPMATGFLSIKKGDFRYEPDFALGLNGKPWMANHWFRYSMVEKKKWKLNTAINPFLFFENIQAGTEATLIRVQRNISFEISGEFNPTSRSILYMVYRYNKGNDGGLSGHLFELNSILKIYTGDSGIFIVFRPQLFYFDFSGNTDGLFASGGLMVGSRKVPFSFQVQSVWLVKAEFPADPFSWNIGLTYTF